MDGFKNTTRMRSFTSAADINGTAGRTVGRVPSFAQGGRVGGVDKNNASPDNKGHALVQRSQPTTEAEREGGGRSPLNSGYAKGGQAKHFHVHKHYHEGGKIRTETKSYRSAEKAAERQAEGAKPMMATGGTRDRLSKGGKPFGNIKKGALHRDMGIAKGKKIPTGAIKSKLAHDKASGNTKGVKRDVFALNARKFHHAEGGHIHDQTSIPAGYPDYATGGTINCMNAGGSAYGGMATGGTANPLALGGMPMHRQAPGGALGSLAARRAALQGRALPAAIGASPLMRAKGGLASAKAARSEAKAAARAALREHVNYPAPRGHKGLGKMLRDR